MLPILSEIKMVRARGRLASGALFASGSCSFRERAATLPDRNLAHFCTANSSSGDLQCIGSGL